MAVHGCCPIDTQHSAVEIGQSSRPRPVSKAWCINSNHLNEQTRRRSEQLLIRRKITGRAYTEITIALRDHVTSHVIAVVVAFTIARRRLSHDRH